MGNVSAHYVPCNTVNGTINSIDQLYRSMKQQFREMQREKYSDEDIAATRADYKNTIQKHIDNIRFILDKTTEPDLNELIQITIDLAFKIQNYIPNDEDETPTRKTILDAIMDTISKIQGSSYTVDQKALRKYTLKYNLNHIDSELAFLGRARYSRYAPPEYAFQYDHYNTIRSEIIKELDTLG